MHLTKTKKWTSEQRAILHRLEYSGPRTFASENICPPSNNFPSKGHPKNNSPEQLLEKKESLLELISVSEEQGPYQRMTLVNGQIKNAPLFGFRLVLVLGSQGLGVSRGSLGMPLNHPKGKFPTGRSKCRRPRANESGNILFTWSPRQHAGASKTIFY